MLSLEEDVQAQALRQQGWSISAIARHLGVDRKTVRAYLSGERVPGRRRRSRPTLIEPFLEYCRVRLVDDPHLWASTLFDELAGLGFTGSYPSLTAAIRAHRLRPHCEPCQVSRGGVMSRSSRIRRVRRLSGTGWNCRTRRRVGARAGTRTCWSAPWRTRGAGVRCWPTRKTSRT
jgi:hypothetical protein